MEAENTTQEVEEIIDLPLLCEHCPFAPQTDGGTGQEVTQERAQKQQVDERQMTLPFMQESDANMTPESDASDTQKQRDEALQNVVIQYLMQEQFRLDNDEEACPRAGGDVPETAKDSTKNASQNRPAIRPSQPIILLSNEDEISAQSESDYARKNAEERASNDVAFPPENDKLSEQNMTEKATGNVRAFRRENAAHRDQKTEQHLDR